MSTILTDNTEIMVCDPQMLVHAKHLSKEHANRLLKFALCFGHQNKINNGHLQGTGCRAIEVPPNALLPTPEVNIRFMKYIVIFLMYNVITASLQFSLLQGDQVVT